VSNLRFLLHDAKLLSAFNAIISASVVALGVSYGIPIAINCIRGRRMLPERPFVLPGPLGWIVNLVRQDI
jgi:choline transport protein